eukprot:TRINITY_DN40058_c0_g1_i1.p1 TRINITY_DN40058_c0_g1~~TRINITY_DN40058_c0_g1_i1.p1  ORF type:complete len:1487 (+),score=398.32 TRINITY_DN40058_c0_g1_i1:159-4619(+)
MAHEQNARQSWRRLSWQTLGFLVLALHWPLPARAARPDGKHRLVAAGLHKALQQTTKALLERSDYKAGKQAHHAAAKTSSEGPARRHHQQRLSSQHDHEEEGAIRSEEGQGQGHVRQQAGPDKRHGAVHKAAVSVKTGGGLAKAKGKVQHEQRRREGHRHERHAEVEAQHHNHHADTGSSHENQATIQRHHEKTAAREPLQQLLLQQDKQLHRRHRTTAAHSEASLLVENGTDQAATVASTTAAVRAATAANASSSTTAAPPGTTTALKGTTSTAAVIVTTVAPAASTAGSAIAGTTGTAGASAAAAAAEGSAEAAGTTTAAAASAPAAGTTSDAVAEDPRAAAGAVETTAAFSTTGTSMTTAAAAGGTTGVAASSSRAAAAGETTAAPAETTLGLVATTPVSVVVTTGNAAAAVASTAGVAGTTAVSATEAATTASAEAAGATTAAVGPAANATTAAPSDAEDSAAGTTASEEAVTTGLAIGSIGEAAGTTEAVTGSDGGETATTSSPEGSTAAKNASAVITTSALAGTGAASTASAGESTAAAAAAPAGSVTGGVAAATGEREAEEYDYLGEETGQPEEEGTEEPAEEVSAHEEPKEEAAEEDEGATGLLAGILGGEEPHAAAAGPALKCSASEFAPVDRKCPSECPFLKEDLDEHCMFACVDKKGCLETEASKVADSEQGVCRKCHVVGCELCDQTGLDECAKCMKGFHLKSGKCESGGHMIWIGTLVSIAVAIVGVVVVYMGLFTAPVVNKVVLDAALETMDNNKLLNEEDTRNMLPFSFWDDVHNDPRIGGLGCMLHFDFQWWLLMWALLVAVAWVIFIVSIDSEAFRIGLGGHESPIELCKSMRDGKELRERFADDKCVFIGVLYIVTTIGCLYYTYRQHIKAATVDAEHQSQMDFAVRLDGFPLDAAAAGLEKEYEDFVREVTAQPLVGVSICWDRVKASLDVGELVGKEEDFRFSLFEASLGLQGAPEAEPADAPDAAEAERLLLHMKASGACYAVFETEAAHDMAIKVFEEKQAHFRGEHLIKASAAGIEPIGVNWESFGSTESGFARGFRGVCWIMVVVILWAVFIYAPYGYYAYVIIASTGEPPDAITGLIFTAFVCAGNFVVYTISDIVATSSVMDTVDGKNAVYVACYTLACMVNIILDLGIVFITIYLGFLVNDVHDADGTPIREYADIEKVLSSFPMQKFGGIEMFAFNVLGCFIAPFLAEPFGTIYLPKHLGTLFVGSRPVKYKDAVQIFLAPAPMDLGRYADHLINFALTVMTFFVASGWVIFSLLGFALSVGFCYVYDRARVVYHVERFRYPTTSTDELAQELLGIPCACLCAAWLFCLRHIHYPGLPTSSLTALLMGGFLLHMVVHHLLQQAVLHLAEKAGKQIEHTVKAPYEEVCHKDHHDWFSSNAIHCLRTKYVHKLDKPLNIVAPGQTTLPRKHGGGGQEGATGREAAAGTAAKRESAAEALAAGASPADSPGAPPAEPPAAA